MRLALQRITDPLFGWIPDISAIPTKRMIGWAVIGSTLVHLLLIFGYWLTTIVFPHREDRAPVAERANLEVTVMPMPQEPVPEPAIDPPKPPDRQFLSSDGLKAGEKPKEAKFETDRDMTAASELPARGDSPLPSQDGEKAPVMRDFADQDIQMKAESFALQAEPSPAVAPQSQAAPQAATVAPMYAPQPVSKAALAAAENARADEKLPEPAKPTRATPAPMEKVVTPDATQLAFATPQTPAPAAPPVPTAAETDKVRPAPNNYANFATPSPLAGPSITERYKQEMRKTYNAGEISKRGLNGVDAINTPAGRWSKRMREAMGQNWRMFVRQNSDLVTIGRVRVKFAVGPEGGKATAVKVESDSGDSTSAQICVRAVIETPIPPPPPDLLQDLEGDKLEAEIVFTLY